MTRILTAAILIPLVVFVIFSGNQVLFLAVVSTVALLCYREYCGIADTHGLETDSPLAYAAGLVIVIVPHLDPVIFVLLAMAMLVIAVRTGSLSITLMQSSAVVMGVAYVFGAWRCAAGLRTINPHWLLYALALNWVGDIAAYYVGGMIGRHKLAPRISPGKSWEGAIASVVFSALFGVIYLGRFIPEVPVWEALLLTAAANAVGQMGDLSESALKRGAGLKDSGDLLPGHGGWLDRVDSSLFSLPFVYFWLSRSSMSLL